MPTYHDKDPKSLIRAVLPDAAAVVGRPRQESDAHECTGDARSPTT